MALACKLPEGRHLTGWHVACSRTGRKEVLHMSRILVACSICAGVLLCGTAASAQPRYPVLGANGRVYWIRTPPSQPMGIADRYRTGRATLGQKLYYAKHKFIGNTRVDVTPGRR
jgi:hypothetical protein